MCASRIRISVALAALISALASIPRAAELPLQLHPGNPHYFVYKGRPTVLITSGEHYGAVLNLAFDYVAYEAWEFLVGGGAVYSNLNHAYQVDNPAGRRPESEKFKGYLRSLKNFVEGFDLSRMRQDRTVIASGIDSAENHVSAISEAGKQYAVYVHHSGYGVQRRWYKPDERPRRTSLSLALPAGAYEIEWIRPSDLQALGTERIQHLDGVVALKPSPEYVSDVALRIRATRRD